MAEWIAALAAVAAFMASMLAWRTSERMLRIEESRDRERERQLERSAASRFFAVGAVARNRSETEKWSIYVNNFSTEPVWDVKIYSQKMHGREKNPPLTMKCVPPGAYLITSHEQYHWSAPIDLATSPEPLELLTRSKTSMVTAVEYVDFWGARWEMKEGDRCPKQVGQ